MLSHVNRFIFTQFYSVNFFYCALPKPTSLLLGLLIYSADIPYKCVWSLVFKSIIIDWTWKYVYWAPCIPLNELIFTVEMQFYYIASCLGRAFFSSYTGCFGWFCQVMNFVMIKANVLFTASFRSYCSVCSDRMAMLF